MFYEAPVGDWPFHIFNLNYGKIGYLEEIFGIYRIGGGAWNKKTYEEKLQSIVRVYNHLPKFAPPQYKGDLVLAGASHYWPLIRFYSRQLRLINFTKACIALIKYLLRNED
jgi:hypothetical protein